MKKHWVAIPLLLIICSTALLVSQLEQYDCDVGVPWGEWTEPDGGSRCTEQICGCGTHAMMRRCPVTDCRNPVCRSGEIETTSFKCCVGIKNGSWGDWGTPQCDSYCGVGRMSLRRVCIGAQCGGGCDGPATQQGDLACYNGPCDADVVRVTSSTTLAGILDFRASPNKRVVLLEALDFTEASTRPYINALVGQAAGYRKMAEELSTATGVAFVAVACGMIVDHCRRYGLRADSGNHPQLWLAHKGKLQLYQLNQFLSAGRLSLDVSGDNGTIYDLPNPHHLSTARRPELGL